MFTVALSVILGMAWLVTVLLRRRRRPADTLTIREHIKETLVGLFVVIALLVIAVAVYSKLHPHEAKAPPPKPRVTHSTPASGSWNVF